jgi:hypothetical protein
LAALEVVSHGYLMENGRIVMHDSAEAMKKNPDIQEFYLGGAEGKDFHAIKHYRRRKRWLRGLRRYDRAGLHDFADVVALGARREATQPEAARAASVGPAFDDIGLMVFTSGSTGRPKAAMMSWRGLVTAARGLNTVLGCGERDDIVSYLPLCHVAEQMFSLHVPLATGAVVNFAESLRTVQEDLRELSPQVFFGVPRIWEKFHAAIQTQLRGTGRLRRWLFEMAYDAQHAGADGIDGPRSPRRARAVVLAGDARAAEFHRHAALPRRLFRGRADRARHPALLPPPWRAGARALRPDRIQRRAHPCSAAMPRRSAASARPIRASSSCWVTTARSWCAARSSSAATSRTKPPRARRSTTEGWLHTGDVGTLDRRPRRPRAEASSTARRTS